MAKKKIKSRKNASRSKTKGFVPRNVPRVHWSHPAGYQVGGTKLATLVELLDPSIPTLSWAELNMQQKVDLVVARLRSKPEDFHIRLIGPDRIDKSRAIVEVQSRSKIGRTLIEIEKLLISALAEAHSRE
jgi:hypothetical protein